MGPLSPVAPLTETHSALNFLMDLVHFWDLVYWPKPVPLSAPNGCPLSRGGAHGSPFSAQLFTGLSAFLALSC